MLKRLKTLLIFFVLISWFKLPVMSQTPKLNTGRDCLDWFLVSWEQLAKLDRFACAGVSEMSTSFEVGSLNQEWFFVRIKDDKTKIVSEYLEMQTIYANGAGTGHWRKQLRRGDSFAWASGDRSRPLSDFRTLTAKEQGSSLDERNLQVLQYRYPDPFILTISSASCYDEYYDWTFFSNLFEKGKLEDVETNEENVLICTSTTEYLSTQMEFNSKTGMPLRTVGYFRDDKAENGRGKINFESKIKWEKVDAKREIFAPISITNFTHNVNLKNTGSRRCEISCSYKVNDINLDLLSDENLSSVLESRGDIAELRGELIKKVYKTTKRE
jgi:hypothetical protein